VVFYKQAADKFVEIGDKTKEGFVRSNLASTLFKLNRYDDAMEEILLSIKCVEPFGHSAEPWKAWAILCDVERAAGNLEAAERARARAIELYLAYRRDGGENHESGGRLCTWFRQAIKEERPETISTQLAELAKNPKTHPNLKVLISKLQALLARERDPGLAEDPELDYMDAAEVMLLLEELEG
jgi:tetratricopeptide (TPR) repeat protein